MWQRELDAVINPRLRDAEIILASSPQSYGHVVYSLIGLYYGGVTSRVTGIAL